MKSKKVMLTLRVTGLCASLALVLVGCVNNPGVTPLNGMDELQRLTGLQNGSYTIQLVDENGAPLANYPADYPTEKRNLKYKYRCGGTWAFEASVQTDANGQFVVNPDCSAYAPKQWDGKLTVILNQTSKEQDVRSGNTTFQTARVNVNLKDHNGNPLPGGVVSQGGGYWYTHGTTGSSGTVTFYAFPGSVKVRMDYNYGSQTKDSVPIYSGTNNIDFQTGLVVLHFSGTIQHGVGGYPMYTRPTEMLPVEHRFAFSRSGYPRKELQFTPTAGAVLEYTVAYIRLLSSTGKGVPGATAVWWIYGGRSVPVSGATDSDGVLLNPMPGKITANTAVALTYERATQTKWQNNPSANSFYVFQLVSVTVELRDNTGALIAGASPVVYYWPYGGSPGTAMVFGTMVNGVVKKDVLPGHPNGYLFMITDFNKSSQQIGPFTINASTTVTFRTGKVVDGGFGCLWYWQYGGPKGAFIDGIQLLPGNFFFQNSSTTKNLTVKAGQTLNIQTGSYTTP